MEMEGRNSRYCRELGESIFEAPAEAIFWLFCCGTGANAGRGQIVEITGENLNRRRRVPSWTRFVRMEHSGTS
jgi:hypothetical protein